MNQGKYVFAQLTDFLPRRTFDRIVHKHSGNKYVRSFTCWNQMLCMVFGQLTARDSMRDLILSLEAHKPKYYHLGFGKTISRRNLGIANERRSGDTEDFNNLMSTGVILLDQNKFTEAIKSFKKAAKILPDNTAPDVQIAKSKEARINMEAKLTAYSEEIELASNYIDTKEYAKTLRHLKNAQDILPDNWALANEIKTFTLLATKQNPPNQIDRIENKQVITQFSETDNKSLISRKPTEILPVITKSRASMINYKPSLTLVSDNSSQNNYQSEIDIMIEQNQKEIKVIEDTSGEW